MKILCYSQSEVAPSRGIGETRWPFHDLFMLQRGRTILFTDGQPNDLNAGDIILLAPEVQFFSREMLVPSLVRVLHFQFEDCAEGALRHLLTRKTSTVFRGIFNYPPVKRLILRIAELHQPKHLSKDELLITHLTWSLLAELVRTTEKYGLESRHSITIRQVCQWAEKNIGQSQTITNLAQKAGFSESHFRALFRDIYGISAGAWLEQLRMTEARRLLKSTNMPIKEISLAVGYSDVEAFHRAFVRNEALTPGLYRRLNPPVF